MMEDEEVVSAQQNFMQDLFAGSISIQDATAGLESVSIFEDCHPESGVSRLWSVILREARDSPRNHDKLVELLVALSKRPSPKSSQLVMYDMEVWKDLPMLGWALRDQWNFRARPDVPPLQRHKDACDFISINRFVALLMATGEEVFNYSWYALITLREALETKPRVAREEFVMNLNAFIPAAAAWIEILGVEIFEWDEEFPSGGIHGAPGSGGDLWDGMHGFCWERWELWKERFEKFGKGETWEIEEEARKAAEEAAIMMKEIEEGRVE